MLTLIVTKVLNYLFKCTDLGSLNNRQLDNSGFVLISFRGPRYLSSMQEPTPVGPVARILASLGK